MNTGIYAGLCGVLLVLLYLRISQRRLASKRVAMFFNYVNFHFWHSRQLSSIAGQTRESCMNPTPSG
jgi:hypothetical protein